MIPWKLIFFLIILTIVVLFAGFNINNTSDVSFGFKTAKDVPIFISLFIAFLLGNFVMLPFALSRTRKTRKAKKAKKEAKQEKMEKKELKKALKGKKGSKESLETPESDPFSSDTYKDGDS